MERKQKTEKGHDGVRWLRKFGLFVLPAAAILSLVGCSKDWADSPGDASGTVALDFSVEGIGEMLPATKAALASNTTVRVVAYKSNTSNPATANYVADQAYYWNGTKLVPCTVDANGNKTADAAEQEMKLPYDNTYDFYAVSPALPLATDKKTLSTAVNNGMDYATTTSKTTMQIPEQTTPYALTLNTLQRQFAQVKFNVTSIGLTAVNLVELAGLADAVSGVTVGSALTAASSGTQSFSIGESAFTISGGTATATMTVLPINNAELSLTVTLTVDGVQSQATGTLGSATLENGKSYTVTAAFNTESAEFDISTGVEWTANSGNNPGFDISRTYPYVIDGNILVFQDKYGRVANTTIHGVMNQQPVCTGGGTWDDTNNPLNSVGERVLIGEEYTAVNVHYTNRLAACKAPWRMPTGAEIRYLEQLVKNGSEIRLKQLDLSNAEFWTNHEVEGEIGAQSLKWRFVSIWSRGKRSRKYILDESGTYGTEGKSNVLCVRDLGPGEG